MYFVPLAGSYLTVRFHNIWFEGIMSAVNLHCKSKALMSNIVHMCGPQINCFNALPYGAVAFDLENIPSSDYKLLECGS